MRRHWQRRPLLVRQAFAGFTSPLDGVQIRELASQAAVESRLVTCFDGQWSLRRGPLPRRIIPSIGRAGWSVLLQGMDTHLQVAQDVLTRFRFISDARLDDLMISYASPGGGVGPHVDSYDVFLIQAQGRRRWRIAPPGDATLIDGVPLKLLAQFEPTQQWVLEPGDMLYLPPGWGHDGVALDECQTWSVGFRAPSRHEILAAWFSELADAPPGGPDPRYRDPGSPPTAHPARIPEAMSGQVGAWIRSARPERIHIEQFLGRFLTEPKPGVWFDSKEPIMSSGRWQKLASQRGLRLDLRTRMLYRGRSLFVNGEAFDIGPPSATLLRRLADLRVLLPEQCQQLPPPTLEVLQQWHEDGWLGWLTEPQRRTRRANLS